MFADRKTLSKGELELKAYLLNHKRQYVLDHVKELTGCDSEDTLISRVNYFLEKVPERKCLFGYLSRLFRSLTLCASRDTQGKETTLLPMQPVSKVTQAPRHVQAKV